MADIWNDYRVDLLCRNALFIRIYALVIGPSSPLIAVKAPKLHNMVLLYSLYSDSLG